MRRYLRFAIRSFLLLLVIACLIGGYYANRAHQQRKAIQRIEELGGVVAFDWNRGVGDTDPFSLWDVPNPGDNFQPKTHWLSGILGDEYFQTIASIGFRDIDNLPADAFKDLSGLENIKEIIFVSSKVDDQHLHDIGQLTNLEVVYFLGSSKVSMEGLELLSQAKNIRSLHLSTNESAVGPKLDEYQAWPIINSMQNLESIWIDGYAIKNVEIHDLKKLKSVHLAGTKVPSKIQIDNGITKTLKVSTLSSIKLKRLPQLSHLCLISSLTSKEAIKKLWLEDLDSFEELGDVLLNPLEDDVYKFNIALDKENHAYPSLQIMINRLPKLKRLGINPSLEKMSITGLKTAPNLKLISAMYVTLTDRLVQEISKSRSLEELNLRKSSITDQQFKYIARLNQLKKLDISSTELSDTCIDDLLRLINLEELSIVDTYISENGIKLIRKLPKLNKLIIVENKELFWDLENEK